VNLSLLRNQTVWQKLKTTNGAYIWRSGDYPFTAKSLGRAAGLREGDIIVKIESEGLNARRDLAEIISEYGVGTKLNLGVLRDGKEMTIEVNLK
jgi:type II secretory pathway component PulC